MGLKMKSAILSFWKIFSLIFIAFSLYLLGDAFSRWDGFRYYASFSEFLPSVSLAAILWSIIAVFIAIIIWIPGRILEWFSLRMGFRVRVENLFLVVCICVLFIAATILLAKTLHLTYLVRVFKSKTIFILGATLAVMILFWMLRNKIDNWMNILQERIAPLIWLFGVFLFSSFFIVAYHTLGNKTEIAVEQYDQQLSKNDLNKPNIILVTFDALTARDMSVYGYGKKTTPFISKWAESASLFRRVKAESNITTPTTASLMTGKRLWTHQSYHISGGSKPVKSEIENIPLLLRENGYYNMAFIVNPFASVRKLGIEGSFDVAPIETGFSKQANLLGKIDVVLYQWFGNKIRLYNWVLQRDFILFRILNKMSRNFSKTTAPPEKAFEKFIKVLSDSPPTPFFAWIHLYPPHDPYLPPSPFMGMFDSSSYLRTYKSQDDVVKRASRYHRQYKQFPPEVRPDVNKLRARYDEFIGYCDSQFEAFISLLEKRGVLKDSIVILSSDHGESFEHNSIKHSFNNLYEQITHIPLIIKLPDQVDGRIIDDLTEQIDIPATILDIAGIPLPLWIEGRSLVPLLRGRGLPEKIAFSMALEGQASRGHEISNGKFAAWKGDYKLIHQLENNKSMLFNLMEDPGELKNLFDKEKNVGKNLLGLIQDNLKMANERIRREQRITIKERTMK
jgi:arylsulfatase A-like enzyme